MEEKVREWQDCAASSRNIWITEQSSWVDVVASALKFMSGDVIGMQGYEIVDQSAINKLNYFMLVMHLYNTTCAFI